MPGWKPLIDLCDPTSTDIAKRCGIAAFVTLIKNGITDLILLSTLVAVLAFVWAGFMLLTSQGDVGKRKEAKSLFMSIVWGYVWILGAWLIVYTITSTLLGSNFNFFLQP